MRPTAVDLSSKKGLVILHCCEKCGFERRNTAAPDDDREKLLFLTNVYNR